ncbi:hypothetical protein TNCV_4982301 [Trichonephila clavipes]|nr:hypothetical protein TNCV_4982301 [Trichonephila clavipes]
MNSLEAWIEAMLIQRILIKDSTAAAVGIFEQSYPMKEFVILLRGRGGLGSNLREDVDVCKCIVPAPHGGTLNGRRAASPLVRLVEGEERCGPLTPTECSPFKLGWNRA